MSKRAAYPSLDGTTVLITGGASGIGAVLVEEFVRQGSHVAFLDRDATAGKALAAKLAKNSVGKVWFRDVDVTDVPALTDVIVDAATELGAFQVLVNNVGNDTRHSPETVTPAFWRDCLAVNLDAAFFAAQAVYASMRDAGRGSIINLSSINALLGPPNMPGYVTAKAGLIGMTKALARDYGPSNTRVNAVLPGWVVTERQLDKWLTPEAEAEWMKQVALPGRLHPEDVASVVMFLAADDSAMITGQSFTVDGGRT